MDLKQVRYFIAVADAGSFSAGAKRAFVTQPTLSTALLRSRENLDSRYSSERPAASA
jgi:DNA-binding transcriptional LysR family regulator